jgi:hypothetical protein
LAAKTTPGGLFTPTVALPSSWNTMSLVRAVAATMAAKQERVGSYSGQRTLGGDSADGNCGK